MFLTRRIKINTPEIAEEKVLTALNAVQKALDGLGLKVGWCRCSLSHEAP